MNNAINFTKTGDSLSGVEGTHMYLGQTFIDLGTGDADADADLTAAIRDFNLPTAVAPGNWPAARTADMAEEFSPAYNYSDDILRGLLATEEWCNS